MLWNPPSIKRTKIYICLLYYCRFVLIVMHSCFCTGFLFCHFGLSCFVWLFTEFLFCRFGFLLHILLSFFIFYISSWIFFAGLNSHFIGILEWSLKKSKNSKIHFQKTSKIFLNFYVFSFLIYLSVFNTFLFYRTDLLSSLYIGKTKLT